MTKSLAQGADAVVLVVGLVSEAIENPDEAEGHDRTAHLTHAAFDVITKRMLRGCYATRMLLMAFCFGIYYRDVSGAAWQPGGADQVQSRHLTMPQFRTTILLSYT